MEEVTIREAQPDDAEALAAYLARLVEERPDTLGLWDVAPSAEDQRQWLARNAETKHAFALGAFDGAVCIGLCDFRPTPGFKRTASGSFGVSVDRAWRGKGIGRRLIEALTARAKAERPDLARIELECVPWNLDGIALYEKLGFRHEGRKEHAVLFRGRPEPMLVMAKIWDEGDTL